MKRYILFLVFILSISCSNKYKLILLYEIEANKKDFVSIKIDDVMIFTDSVYRPDKKAGDMLLLDTYIQKPNVKFEVSINNADTLFYYDIRSAPSIKFILNLVILNLEKSHEWVSD